MRRWEYKICRLGLFKTIEKDFNDLGDEGWELVAVTFHNIAFFKKEWKI